MTMRTPLTLVLLSVLLAFCDAQGTTEATRPSLKPEDNPALATWIIIGVIMATTMSVLVLLVPTLLYHKYMDLKDTKNDNIKK